MMRRIDTQGRLCIGDFFKSNADYVYIAVEKIPNFKGPRPLIIANQEDPQLFTLSKVKLDAKHRIIFSKSLLKMLSWNYGDSVVVTKHQNQIKVFLLERG